MIKANELRIGNWLYVSGNTIDTYQTSKPKQVTIEFLNAIKIENEERPDGVLTWFDPIPLTPEILEKCGFKKEPNKIDIYTKSRLRLWLGARGSCICYLVEEDTTTGHYIPNQVSYLHQLQNLYWCLCGEELTYTP